MASSSGGYSGLRASLNSQASSSGGYSGLRASLIPRPVVQEAIVG